MQDENEAK